MRKFAPIVTKPANLINVLKIMKNRKKFLAIEIAIAKPIMTQLQ